MNKSFFYPLCVFCLLIFNTSYSQFWEEEDPKTLIPENVPEILLGKKVKIGGGEEGWGAFYKSFDYRNLEFSDPIGNFGTYNSDYEYEKSELSNYFNQEFEVEDVLYLGYKDYAGIKKEVYLLHLNNRKSGDLYVAFSDFITDYLSFPDGEILSSKEVIFEDILSYGSTKYYKHNGLTLSSDTNKNNFYISFGAIFNQDYSKNSNMNGLEIRFRNGKKISRSNLDIQLAKKYEGFEALDGQTYSARYRLNAGIFDLSAEEISDLKYASIESISFLGNNREFNLEDAEKIKTQFSCLYTYIINMESY